MPKRHATHEAHDVPITREFWHALEAGWLPKDAFDEFLLEHHLASCKTCEQELAAYRAERSRQPAGARDHPPEALQQAPQGQERLFLELLELSPEQQSERLRLLRPSPMLVQQILQKSFAALPQQPSLSLEMGRLAQFAAEGSPAQEHLVLTHAYQANAFRALGRLSDAEREFAEARLILHRPDRQGVRLTDLEVYATVDWMEGAYLRERLDLDDAEMLLKRARTLFAIRRDRTRVLQVTVSIGDLHLRRGSARDALEAISTVLVHADEVADHDLYWMARLNHAIYLAESGLFDAARAELRTFQMSAAPLAADRFFVLRARWLEGRMALGVGQYTQAEQVLSEVRRGYIADGQGVNGALVALDLARCYSKLGKTTEYGRLSKEIAVILTERGIARQRIAALLEATART